jgi:spermidine synthase
MARFAPRFAVFALGFSAVVTQLVLLRELLSAFSGNEICLGVMLGSWLLLMGLGSWAGRTAARLRNGAGVFAWAQILIALWPLVAVFLLRMLRDVVFTRGVEVGVVETVLGCIVVLLPYCLASGYLLTLASVAPLTPPYPPLEQRGGEQQPLGVGTVYFLDSAGSIAGGVLFTFVLLHVFSPFGVLAVPAFASLLAVVLLATPPCPPLEQRGGKQRRRTIATAVALVAAIGLAVLLVVCDFEKLTTAAQYPGANVVFTGHSPYGHLVVSESSGQYNFFENGVPYFSTQNTEEVEEKVHYAMAQRPKARCVLLVSGGVSGTAKEILKYGVERVDYVELDPLIIQAGRTYVAEDLADPRINVICADARVFARETHERYDVVIVDVPDPTTSQLNRFYTREFYNAVNSILTPDGVLCCAAGEYRDYVSPELVRVLATVHATLKPVFANVLIIPGELKIVVLASQGTLHEDIGERIEQAGVKTVWMRPSMLSTVLTPQRMADMQRAVAEPGAANEDFSPVLYYAHLREWLSKFRARLGVWVAGLLALMAVFLWRIRAVPFAIFTAGFAASALEIVLLMGFQIVFGSVYQQLGLIITAFMGGLALGAWQGKRHGPDTAPLRGTLVRNLAFCIAAFAAVLPFVMKVIGAATVVTQVAFVLLAFGIAALVGAQFAAAGRDASGAGASELYTADFLGACLGALLASTLLIPLLGVTLVCELIGAVNLLAGVVVLVRRGRVG